jgi:DNA replication and repair protein RecF
MKLETLKLTNFRNHKKFKMDPNGESILIRGPNGCGKSNILEAINLLSTAKSLRTKYDRELINHGAQHAQIGAKAFVDEDVTILEMTVSKTKINKNGSTKTVKINKVNKSIQNFVGTLTSVLFTPTDIEILAGPPSIRRKYIDSIFFQVDKDYKRVHSQYVKAVRQRNKLLEKLNEGSAHDGQLGFWDEKILELGSSIQRRRRDFFTFVNKAILGYTTTLNSADVAYKLQYKQNNITHKRLEEYRTAEIASKNTLLGPHRDDFSVIFDGFDLSSFGSRGQQRTTILALKLCEIDFITETTQKRPILLLDDIFSELDPAHKDAVNNIIDLQQTIVTTALKSGDDIEIENLK